MPYSTSGFMAAFLETSKYNSLTSSSSARVSIAISQADNDIDNVLSKKFVTPIASPTSEIEFISMSLAVGYLSKARGVEEPGLKALREDAEKKLQSFLEGEERPGCLVSKGSGYLYPSYTPEVSTAQSNAMTRNVLDRLMK